MKTTKTELEVKQDHPTFAITFKVGRGRKEHKVYGVWCAELKKDKTMWIYTNAKDGAHYIENVNVIEMVDNANGIDFTSEETKKLIHLL